MTTLIIYRGETEIAQVPLTGKTMKLGRAKDNDVVLDDPGKGVSRVHAELRREGDRYRLVDLQSQNGIWVSGQRVPSILLAPGVVVAMGPFRVAIDASSPKTQAVPIVRDESLLDTGTEINRPIPVMPPSGAPPPSAPAERAADEAAHVEGTEGTVPPVEGIVTAPGDAAAVAAAPKAAPKAAPTATVPRRAAAAPGGKPASRTPMLVAAGAILILACAFGAYKLVLHKAKPQPVWDAAAAAALVDSGRCQEAMDQQITRALAADPNDAEALRLKAKCAQPPPPPPAAPTPPPVVAETAAQKLDKGEAALLGNSCQAALDTANEVLAADANDERAKTLAQKATDCLKPPPVPGQPATDALVRVPPAQGGLDPQPGESGKDYKARMAASRKRYDDAVALLQGQRYQQALRELDALANQVPPGYLELAQRRGDARNGLREESARSYAAAQEAEQRSDWNTATTQYQRAHDLDSARDVSADLARITDAKTRLGRQLCGEAEAAFTLGHNNDAAEKFTRVLSLLPSSDDCYTKAKDRLAKLGR